MINPRWDTEAKLGQPVFNLHIYKRLDQDPDRIRIDIAFELMNDVMLFVREDTTFAASVEVDLSIFDRGEKRVSRQVQHLSKCVTDFEKTNSQTDFLDGVFTEFLPPGDYEVVVILTDRESRRRERISRQVTLQLAKGEKLNVSDLLLARSSEIDESSRLPRNLSVGGLVSDRSEELYAYFDLLRKDPLQVCDAVLSVLDCDGHRRSSDSLTIVGGETLSSYLLSVPCHKLEYGAYTVRLTVESGGCTVSREVKIKVNYFGLPGSVHDIELAIEQLKYIATDEEITAIKNAPEGEKGEKFLEFWNQNFPTPGEAVNGKMKEYYNRIAYANRHFSATRPGWETDRGRILAIYGQPSEVERQTFNEQGVPYEIWYYNHLGKRFVFRDEYGFGEYRLVTQGW